MKQRNIYTIIFLFVFGIWLLRITAPINRFAGFISLLSMFLSALFLAIPIGALIQKWQQSQITRLTKIVITAIGLGFFVFFLTFSLHKYNYFTNGYDLAIFDQAIWYLSQFKIPASSLRGVPNIFADHFHPIIMVLTPLYWIAADARVLLVMQAILLVAPVWLLFAWAKKWKLSALEIIMIVSIYVTSPPVQALPLYDFHEIVFAPILFFAAVFFAAEKKWYFYLVSIVLLILTKEPLTLFVVALGFFIWLQEKETLMGWFTIIFGTVSFLGITKYFIPLLAGPDKSYAYFAMYPGFEHGIIPGIISYLSHPTQLWHNIKNGPDTWWNIILFTVPYLPVIALLLPVGILFLPLFAERLFSSDATLSLIFHHHILFPVVGICGVFYLFKKKPHLLEPEIPLIRKLFNLSISRGVFLLSFILLGQLTYSYYYSYLFHARLNWNRIISPAAETYTQMTELIPEDANVAATQPFLPRLSHREQLTVVPNVKDAEYILLHQCTNTAACLNWPVSQYHLLQLPILFSNHPAYETIFSNQYGSMYKRIRPLTVEEETFLVGMCEALVDEAGLLPVHQYVKENCRI